MVPPADPAPSYGTAEGAAVPPTRPGLPPRGPSLQSARHLAGASGLAPTTTMRQSGSLRALFRMTSTVNGNASADSVAPTPKPAMAPLQQTRSLRGPRRPTRETVPLLRRSLTTSQLPPLARAMSSMLRLPRKEVETFRCHICFDDAVPVSEAVTLSTCKHRYCTACFKSYLEIKIKEGNVYPVCFHPMVDDPVRKTCGATVETNQIEQLVDAEIWKKLHLFRFNKEHEHARECPHCGFSQDCKGPESPECECAQCGKPFCFFHDIAHDGRSCADYELENAEAESMNRATISQIAKPCPGCQRDVEKDGGCNHMKCVVCQTSFCWLCGDIIEDVPMPSHFSESSESGCSGKQFDGTEPIELPWHMRLYALLIAVLCYPIAFVIAVLSTPITWCRSSSEDDNSFGDMFWFNHTLAMIWLALVISLLFFVVAIVVELTFRLVVSMVTLPFVILSAIVRKVVSCCRRSPERQPVVGEQTAVIDPQVDEEEDEPDLEAGQANGAMPPAAKEEGERVPATPQAVVAGGA